MKTKTQSFNQKTRDWWRSKINIYGFLSIKKTFFLFGIRLNTYVCNISLLLSRSFYVFIFLLLVNMFVFFFGAHLILFGARVCLYENSVIAYNRPKLKTSTLFHLKIAVYIFPFAPSDSRCVHEGNDFSLSLVLLLFFSPLLLIFLSTVYYNR